MKGIIMKRIITLALAAGLFMGASVSAEAAEINVSGLYKIAGAGYDALNLQEGDNSDMNVYQRAEFVLDIVNSENLSARFKVRVPGSDIWGAEAFVPGGGNLDVQLKSAYIDWIVPTTDVMVRMGLQSIALPSVLGSNVLDDDFAGVTVAVPFSDMVALNAIWARPVDGVSGTASAADPNGATTLDVFALTLPITMETVNITPWVAYAMAGENTPNLASTDANSVDWEKATALVGESNWFAGFTTSFMMFDPFTVDFGFTYGASQDVLAKTNTDASGWIAEAKLSYATNYGTPFLMGWYASGDEGGEKDFGRLPEINGGQGPMLSGYFDETAIGGLIPSTGITTRAGTWGLGLGWSGYQPMDDLTLRGHVMYIAGTNAHDGAAGNQGAYNYLTYGDNVIELTAAADYAIYKDLSAIVEVNYLIADIENYGQAEQNGYRASVGFLYSF